MGHSPRFLNAELSWPTQKVDDTLLPIIRKVGLRGKVGVYELF